MTVSPLIRAFFRLLFASIAVATAVGAADLPGASPFVPPAGAAPNAEPAAAEYELVGMTSVGTETLLSIQRRSEGRSVWIPVGKTVAEITVVKYDSAKEEAEIRVGTQVLTLPMRKSSVRDGTGIPAAARPASGRAVAPIPPAPAPAVPTKPLTAQEEKEMEARMLVSDLLEIGLQQRKAYAAAQREAAAKADAAKATAKPDRPASPPSPAAPTPPAPDAADRKK